MDRLKIWIDNGNWDRVKWLLESGYHLDGEPSAMLSSRVDAAIRSADDDDSVALLTKVADAFNIATMTESDDVEQPVTEAE